MTQVLTSRRSKVSFTSARAFVSSKDLQENTSMFMYWRFGNVWTLMWLSAIITNPVTHQTDDDSADLLRGITHALAGC